jgi:transposase
MTVPADVEAEIRRLHIAEGWPVGTVASQLGVHHDVVERVLGLQTPGDESEEHPLIITPFSDFVAETLKTYPRLCAIRIFDMVVKRGYTGSERTVRRHVAQVRPHPQREAYLRIDPLKGEQAQIDWAHVGKVDVPGGRRSLWLFIIVLSWSRAQWGEFVFDLTAHSLIRSLGRAAQYFGGTSRQWLFDNPKSVVLERFGQAVRFHPLLLDLAGRFNTQLRVCAVRKANQKGRVERAIRWWRQRFLAGRVIRCIEQGNRELNEFVTTTVLDRPHPTIPGKSVRQCLAEEQEVLLRLPESPPPTEQVTPVTVDKTAFVRFDTNSYSVPPEQASSALSLAASDQTVRLLDAIGAPVAEHQRNWGRRQIVESPEHRTALLAQKRGARESKGRDRLRAACPQVDTLVERWVEAGCKIGSMTARALKLLDLYGAELFAAAIAEVISRGTWDIGAIAHVCEQHRVAAARVVPVPVNFGPHVPDRDVIPHPLESYDVLRSR